jgi:hypothetical protein
MKRQKSDSLDRMLSLRLKKAVDNERRADWLDVRERAGMGRPVWHWSRRRVLLVAGALVLAVGAAGASTGLIPWLNRKPAEIQAPKLAPPCKAENLSAKLSYDLSNGNHELYGSFILVNTGSRACSLVGRARLALIDPRVSKPRLFLKYTPPEPSPQGVIEMNPRSLLRAVPNNRGVAFSFSWKNWCGSGPSPKGLELRLANGQRFVEPLSAAPRCEKKRWQTALQYWSPQPDWIPESVTSSYWLKAHTPLHASIVTAGLPTIRRKSPNAPGRPPRTYLRVQRGMVFRYRVALRNTSEHPFRFKRCPLYMEFLLSQSHTDAAPRASEFLLNCRPAGAIAPGKSAVFAMELYVPEDAPLGEYLLQWGTFSRRFPPHAEQLAWVVP